MSNRFVDFVIFGIIGIILGITIGMLMLVADYATRNAAYEMWQQEAIQRNFGEICSNTGEWSWIGECEE